jgi:peptidoglycan/xylan/chitin deacetylase (PgdA/CDA1 family)
MRVPVLTYHAMNIAGNDYANNDHVALAEDLRTIARLGYRVVRLHDVVDALLGLRSADDLERCVAITFDDGSWFDWYDMEHPTHGPQRGFASILREHGAPATSFVIASPEARTALDRTCMLGRGWWGDEWWPEATREGLIAIESHSWDHQHDSIGLAGRFDVVDDYASADREIRQAADYIDALCAPHRASLFAYPYGQSSPYLTRDYMPGCMHEHRLRAAFTTEPAVVSASSSPWALPRFVCGNHWRSMTALEELLH